VSLLKTANFLSMSTPLEPTAAQRSEIDQLTLEFIEAWNSTIPEMDAIASGLTDDQIITLMEAPGETGRPFKHILRTLDEAGQAGTLHPSGGHLSYIPNAGLFTGAIGEHLASSLNRYTGVSGAAPGMTAIETGITNWIASLFGVGHNSASILLSGGSMANMTAIVAARVNRLGEHFDDGVLYVTNHTHHSVAKSARIAGFRENQIRVIEVNKNLQMDPLALDRAVLEDVAAGLRPFLVISSAGTTDTGTVDDLDAVADIAEQHSLWIHTDAAYGGFFQLTERGKAAFAGIERSDSITLDPHKGLSIPFGVGALVVKDRDVLIDANHGRGVYFDDDEVVQGLRDISSLGPELSRPFRGLQVWLPLHLHGIAPFREALDLALDLAAYTFERCQSIEGIRTLWEPDLSIVAIGFDDDELGKAAMAAVNADRKVHLSSTIVDERFVLRFAILNRRTTQDHLDHALDIIEKTMIG
jgi:aromatic-L-amino-acid/L-tryptophan decarboxylase